MRIDASRRDERCNGIEADGRGGILIGETTSRVRNDERSKDSNVSY